MHFLRILALACAAALASGCGKDNAANQLPPLAIRGVDASFIPDIQAKGVTPFNDQGQRENMLATLKKAGVNAIRVRVWHSPADGVSGLPEVKAFADDIRSHGMKVWLTVHYADSWADPGKQPTPAAWAGLPFETLKDSVYQYTRQLMIALRPDIIQIGNEINGGLLWPQGRYDQPAQMKALLQQGILGARSTASNAQIMLHYAGYEGAPEFLNSLRDLDYDLIGISYYPNWHGRNLDDLDRGLRRLATDFGKPIILAETSYPFTFEWGDQTNNVIGTPAQILDEYPPTPQGQLDFLLRIRQIVANVPGGMGMCYWGAEWIAYKGPNATPDGSTWENQALWNLGHRALPAMKAFAE